LPIDLCRWRPRASTSKSVTRYVCPVIMVIMAFVLFSGGLWADDKGSSREIRQGHFSFRLPEKFRPFKAEGLPSPAFPDTPWGRVYEKRVKDLDRVFVAYERDEAVWVGLKVEPYRGKLRKTLPFDEFASPGNIDTFRYTLAGQLAVHGLSQIDVTVSSVRPEKGIIAFSSTFDLADGRKAEENYVSILGSHEIVYLILFCSPPAGLGVQASLFGPLVASFQFEPGYGYDPNPRNWWQRRTWSERIEDVVKLAALFFIVYLGCTWGLGSLLGSVIRNPWAMRALVVLVTSVVCVAVASWTVFQ
jgi:hypothetical protein